MYVSLPTRFVLWGRDAACVVLGVLSEARER